MPKFYSNENHSMSYIHNSHEWNNIDTALKQHNISIRKPSLMYLPPILEPLLNKTHAHVLHHTRIHSSEM